MAASLDGLARPKKVIHIQQLPTGVLQVAVDGKYVTREKGICCLPSIAQAYEDFFDAWEMRGDALCGTVNHRKA